ncbi:MAG: VWA domain-containing protein, partial [Bacteroidetes bacterium]|nr:VWA domain-containing protein [Bacteroidota bacterium]
MIHQFYLTSNQSNLTPKLLIYKKMNKKTITPGHSAPTYAQDATHYHLILDKSGSMSTHYVETLQALNNKFEGIRATQSDHPDIPIFVSLTLFSDSPELVFEQRSAAELRPLTEADYALNGMTALLDATGTVIERMQYLLRHDIKNHNANAMVLIFTDGHENASRRFTYADIGEKIKRLGSDPAWSFAFVGADIDAWDVASRINFNRSNVYSSYKRDVGHTMHMLTNEFEK